MSNIIKLDRRDNQNWRAEIGEYFDFIVKEEI